MAREQWTLYTMPLKQWSYKNKSDYNVLYSLRFNYCVIVTIHKYEYLLTSTRFLHPPLMQIGYFFSTLVFPRGEAYNVKEWIRRL